MCLTFFLEDPSLRQKQYKTTAGMYINKSATRTETAKRTISYSVWFVLQITYFNDVGWTPHQLIIQTMNQLLYLKSYLIISAGVMSSDPSVHNDYSQQSKYANDHEAWKISVLLSNGYSTCSSHEQLVSRAFITSGFVELHPFRVYNLCSAGKNKWFKLFFIVVVVVVW